jgi:hypothetical protein
MPTSEWDWRTYGPVSVAVHPTGLAKFTPWEWPLDEINRHLPERLQLVECVLGSEGLVAALVKKNIDVYHHGSH